RPPRSHMRTLFVGTSRGRVHRGPARREVRCDCCLARAQFLASDTLLTDTALSRAPDLSGSKVQRWNRLTSRSDRAAPALNSLKRATVQQAGSVAGLVCGLNSLPFSTTRTTAKEASVQRKNPVANGKSVPS